MDSASSRPEYTLVYPRPKKRDRPPPKEVRMGFGYGTPWNWNGPLSVMVENKPVAAAEPAVDDASHRSATFETESDLLDSSPPPASTPSRLSQLSPSPSSLVESPQTLADTTVNGMNVHTTLPSGSKNEIRLRALDRKALRLLNTAVYRAFVSLGCAPKDVILCVQMYSKTGFVKNGTVTCPVILPVQIQPSFSVTVLHDSPPILLLNSLLTDHEADYVVQLAKSSGLVPSAMGSQTTQCHRADGRTSTNAFLKKSEDEVIDRIERRCAAIMGTTSDCLEALQVVYYDKGKEFRPHWDCYDSSTVVGRRSFAAGYQRYMSMFVFLASSVRAPVFLRLSVTVTCIPFFLVVRFHSSA